MAHNYVREWREFEHLSELPVLEDLVFIGNPLEEDCASAGAYNDQVIRRLLYLKKLGIMSVGTYIKNRTTNTPELLLVKETFVDC